jgi:hypothetical protein
MILRRLTMTMAVPHIAEFTMRGSAPLSSPAGPSSRKISSTTARTELASLCALIATCSHRSRQHKQNISLSCALGAPGKLS